MRRLHVQFYLAILAALVVITVASGLFWRFSDERNSRALSLGTAAELAQLLLPPASASPAEQQRTIDTLHPRLQMDLALFDREGRLLATTPDAPRVAPRRLEPGGWRLARGAGHVWILPLDAQHQLVGAGPTVITRGILNSSLVHPREVFIAAIASRAAAVILVHNHPSGDPTPSPDDRAVTDQLVAAGRVLDIPVFDHVIIGDGRYTSFAEAGLL